MKTCLICDTTSAAPTCPNCGEASWMVADMRAAPEPEAEPEPAMDDVAESIKPRRGRRSK